MEDQDDLFPDDEQAIRDQIDDEIVNRELMERIEAQTSIDIVSWCPLIGVNLPTQRHSDRRL